jgi:membrane associated rhomboid family serine protease
MFVLLSFGQAVEQYFSFYFGTKAYLYYVLLYAGGIVFSVLYDYGKHKDDIYYNAVGASGAVSAVVFSNILFNPTSKLYIFLIPIGIPAIIFGVLYLVYSAYMSKRGSDNIGHNAHFYGALFGIFFTIILKPKLLLVFYQQIAALFGN